MIDYRVYLVTDDPSRYRGNWLDNVRAAVDGGVTCVQYRDTESGPQERYARALALRDMLGGVPLVVNNEAELAAAVKSAGVHVGQSDLPPEAVRAIVGPACEIGLSITDRSQLADLRLHRAHGCVDCVGIGPVFDARRTKADASAALGTAGLCQIVDEIPDVPNCAIGGITPENGRDVLTAGARGLAVVSAFSRSEEPDEVARKFRLLFDDCRQ